MRYKIPARLNRKIGKAMHDYTMISDGDSVIVAVSGGVDSLALGVMLHYWQSKAPITFQLKYIHIDHGFWRNSEMSLAPQAAIGEQLNRFGLNLDVHNEYAIEPEERTCFSCSRNRRSQLFELARELGCNKIALGHHKDDLVETFFLNAIYSGNISTMKPNQQLFAGNLSIVRPMAYLEKKEVIEIAEGYGVEPVKNLCPIADDARREKIRGFLEDLYKDEPSAKNSVFAALSNVRKDYLL